MPLPVVGLVLVLSTIVYGAGGVTNATGMVRRRPLVRLDLRVTSMQYCGVLTINYQVTQQARRICTCTV